MLKRVTNAHMDRATMIDRIKTLNTLTVRQFHEKFVKQGDKHAVAMYHVVLEMNAIVESKIDDPQCPLDDIVATLSIVESGYEKFMSKFTETAKSMN